MLFLAELNNLDIWATDIGNAYLEANTSENVYIIDGLKFGELRGCTLIIHKVLYGWRSSGLQWHMKFSEDLQDIGFSPCIAEPEIWLRKSGKLW